MDNEQIIKNVNTVGDDKKFIIFQFFFLLLSVYLDANPENKHNASIILHYSRLRD